MADLAVDTYTDSNGVAWKIITTANSKQMFATMDQGGRRVYDPEPTDVGPILISEQHGKNDEEKAVWGLTVLTDRIKKDIEGRTPIENIVVTAKPDNSMLIVGVLLALALFGKR